MLLENTTLLDSLRIERIESQDEIYEEIERKNVFCIKSLTEQLEKNTLNINN